MYVNCKTIEQDIAYIFVEINYRKKKHNKRKED